MLARGIGCLYMDPAGNRAGDALDLKASAAEADRDVWCLTLEPSRLCVEVGMPENYNLKDKSRDS